MACVITDRTTKETESKKHPGSKITIKRITQKCSNYSDDLKEEEQEVIGEDNTQELSMEDISNHFSRFMGKHNRDDTYDDIRDFAEAFGEYVNNIKDNMG